MKHHLNTLFVTTDGAYLAKEGQAVAVRIERQTRMRVPIHHLGSIACFGLISVSPALMALCAEQGVSVSFLNEHGRFMARVSGFTPGNVLLRRTQYRAADDPAASAAVTRCLLSAKIANARSVLLRTLRDSPAHPGRAPVEAAALRLAHCIDDLPRAPDLDALRGVEGEAARAYFDVFNHLIADTAAGFEFRGRSRRPPLDNVNALLSFVYALLAHDARSACEVVGLDPAVGFLHRDRPGRPGLALDLMEELRPFLADRLVLSLINRRQVQPTGFTTTESGAVRMDDATRKTLLVAYQQRKQRELLHPFLDEKVTVGLIVHLQARLLARYLRGDLDAYPAFIWK